ncbi:MAG: GTPase HflX [Mariprofundaceae bacterium]|nr:GTPase HflX [Mariprofundaceae bacterium]
MDMIETVEEPAWAMAIHPRITDARWGEHASASRLHEFEQLVLSCDCLLKASKEVSIRKIIPATLMGSGHLESIAEIVKEEELDVIFVDHNLSPVQQKNIETACNAKVVDRTGLILEIFGARARTREGVLQVQLASLNYQLGRLVHSWTHLERQRGGHGFLGGPGERQIELDRRMIRDSIKKLAAELALVQRMRSTQRVGRQRHDIPTIALVGYTNAGKSTLFNRLTKADVYAADQLFATLDPTLRKLELSSHQSLMLSDTVGFVQDLPHELINAFRATLEEVTEADLILHVRDISDAESPMQKTVVEDTLRHLGLDGDHCPPIIEILNKVDQVPDVQSHILDGIDGSRVAVSALTGQGLSELTQLIQTWMQQGDVSCCMKVHISDGKTIAWCHQYAHVHSENLVDDEWMHFELLLDKKYLHHLSA